MNKVKEIINNIKNFLQKNLKVRKPSGLGKFRGNALGISLVVLAIVLGLLYYFKNLFIAATVNGQPISRFEVIKRLEKRDGKTALDNVITEILVLQEAKKLNATVTDAEVSAEIAKVRQELTTQGQNLDTLLSFQQMTMKDFEMQIKLQKTAEKILADKVNATEEEILKFIEDNKSAIPEGMAQEEVRAAAVQQVKSQKMGTELTKWLEMVKAKSSINYFVKYE
jgi:foldase protein PrsA